MGVKVGDYVPFMLRVVEDRDSGNVVLEVTPSAHVSLSQSDIAKYRADAAAEVPVNEPGGIQAP